MAGLELTAQLCSGTLTGGFVGSTEVWLQPRELDGGYYAADPGTAGCILCSLKIEAIENLCSSITLLAQVSLPCLLFTRNAENHVQLRGGTNVAFSPPIEYTIRVRVGQTLPMSLCLVQARTVAAGNAEEVLWR